jgi:hypothetical protein
VAKEERIWIGIDWTRVPKGMQSGTVEFSSDSGQRVSVAVNAFDPVRANREELTGFVETDRYLAIEAPHYTKKVDSASARWEKIEDLGRTGSSMSLFPVTAASVIPGKDAPCLEYELYFFHAGQVQVEAILDPTLNFVPGRGLRYAISTDDDPPQIVDILAQNNSETWATAVKDSVRKVSSTHFISNPGNHILKIWMVDPGVVLQKLVIDLGGVKSSYLGPPESYHAGAAAGPGL